MVRLSKHKLEGTKELDSYHVIDLSDQPEADLEVLKAHFILKFTPLYNPSIQSQALYKTPAQLKSVLGATLLEIKKFIRLNRIKDYSGYYRVTDFHYFARKQDIV